MTRWMHKALERSGLAAIPMVKKVVVGVIGTTVLLIGLALIVLPGPAFIVIPLGLAILASEFAWARRVVRRGRVFVGRKIKRKPQRAAEQVVS